MASDNTLKPEEYPEITDINREAQETGLLLHELDNDILTTVFGDDLETIQRVLVTAQDYQINPANIYSPLSEIYTKISKTQRNLGEKNLNTANEAAIKETVDKAIDNLKELRDDSKRLHEKAK